MRRPRFFPRISRSACISRNDGGAVGILFALTGSMVMIAMSYSISVMQGGMAWSREQSAYDLTTLSASVNAIHYTSSDGTMTSANLALWQADAQAYYLGNIQTNDWFSKTWTQTSFTASYVSTGNGAATVTTGGSGKTAFIAPVNNTATSSTSNTVAPGTQNNQYGGVSGSSTAQLIVKSKLELVMVLDNTGSMSETLSGDSTTKMQGLQTAAKQLVSMLLSSSTADAHIGLVPFASTVNVKGALPQGGTWLNQAFTYNSKGVSMSNWLGCVVEPHDANGYIYPKAYTPSDSLKFTPYYYNVPTAGLTVNTYSRTICQNASSSKTVTSVPYTVSNGVANYCGGYSNSTGGQGNGVTNEIDQGSTNYYSLYSTTITQNTDCITHPVTFLTNNSTTLNNAITAMTPSGSTVIPTGVLWGWRMLSSSWSQAIAGSANGWVSSDTTYPLPETTTALQRVMIVLTDGENDVGVQLLMPNDLYLNGLTGVGNALLAAPTVYRTDGSSMINGRMDAMELHNNTLQSGGVGWPDDIDTFQLAACTAAKASGITIYAITFGSVSDVAQATMQSCANTGNYYAASNSSALSTIFQQIAGNIGSIRLTQ